MTGPEVQGLREVVAEALSGHQRGWDRFWQEMCSCGWRPDLGDTLAAHVADALLAVPEVASLVGDGARVERVRGLVRPQWRSQPDDIPRTYVTAYVAGRNALIDELRAALDQGGSDGGGDLTAEQASGVPESHSDPAEPSGGAT